MQIVHGVTACGAACARQEWRWHARGADLRPTESFSMIAYLVAGAARRVLILEDPPEHDILKVVHQRPSSPVSLLALHFLQETLEAFAAAAAHRHIDKCKDKLALQHK